MPRGSGAIVVHNNLQKGIHGYKVIPYSPRYEYMPILLRSLDLRYANVIHTTPDHACFIKNKDAPLIITFHNYVLDRFMRRYSTLLQRLYYRTGLRVFIRRALKRARAVTAVSKFTAELVRKDLGFQGDIKVIPNGIDSKRFSPIAYKGNDKTVRVLFSGNLTIRKGADLLPYIARRLNRGIHIICTGGLRNQSSSLADDKINFIGSVPYEEMPAMYQSAQMLLMPTVREGFGLAVAEAMSCGLPVVATDCSTMPELIHHERGGYLCRPGDVDEFARRINELAQSPNLRERMGEYNRIRVQEEYRHEDMIKNYRVLFEEVLGA